MQIVAPLLTGIVLVVKLISVAVLMIGLFLNLKDLTIGVLEKDAIQINIVKNRLGGVVLLGLEILIIADIVETIINPAFDEIALLAAIVAIRTVISYFLNKEIQETGSKI
ncbi:Uncharacterized membrane protein [Anaerosphaera aminiphila DSM 21120]|uniref:Uncharacterized membrane protein n=1 Tax=Anaerosphaera aminiphila DSM 21120 TaxID=1120995 RepID=A0A1M5UFH7_9FIRM|nr:DUF1622 domain-containing protein [Anaerosphaera aminiphila]SHH61792.1 Uncharacterized membrane protein [Anaerosphaera aminiphila DSM 21120]